MVSVSVLELGLLVRGLFQGFEGAKRAAASLNAMSMSYQQLISLSQQYQTIGVAGAERSMLMIDAVRNNVLGSTQQLANQVMQIYGHSAAQAQEYVNDIKRMTPAEARQSAVFLGGHMEMKRQRGIQDVAESVGFTAQPGAQQIHTGMMQTTAQMNVETKRIVADYNAKYSQLKQNLINAESTIDERYTQEYQKMYQDRLIQEKDSYNNAYNYQAKNIDKRLSAEQSMYAKAQQEKIDLIKNEYNSRRELIAQDEKVRKKHIEKTTKNRINQKYQKERLRQQIDLKYDKLDIREEHALQKAKSNINKNLIAKESEIGAKRIAQKEASQAKLAAEEAKITSKYMKEQEAALATRYKTEKETIKTDKASLSQKQQEDLKKAVAASPIIREGDAAIASAKNQLKEFTKVKDIVQNNFAEIMKSTEGGVRSFNKFAASLGLTQEQTKNLATQLHAAGLVHKGFVSKTANAQIWLSGVFKKTMAAIVSSLKTFSFLIVIQLVQAIKASIEVFSEFQSKMQNIGAMMDSTAAQTKNFSAEVLELAKKVPIAITEISSSMFYALSSGIGQIEAASGNFTTVMKFMDVATKTSTATMADLKVVVDALTSAINTYYGETTNSINVTRRATMAADTLFLAQIRAKASYEEIAEQISNFIPLAASLNLELGQTMAGFSTITRAGMTVSRSATTMMRIMQSFIKVTPQVSTAAAQMGITMNATTISTEGLAGVISQIRKLIVGEQIDFDALVAAEDDDVKIKEALSKVSGNLTEKLGQLFPNVRALRGMIILAGRGFEGFKNDTAIMTRDIYALAQAMGITVEEIVEMKQKFTDFEIPLKSIMEKLHWLREDQIKQLIYFTGSVNEAFDAFGSTMRVTVGDIQFLRNEMRLAAEASSVVANAFEKNMTTYKSQMQLAQNELDAFKIKFGEAFGPTAVGLVGGLNTYLETTSGNFIKARDSAVEMDDKLKEFTPEHAFAKFAGQVSNLFLTWVAIIVNIPRMIYDIGDAIKNSIVSALDSAKTKLMEFSDGWAAMWKDMFPDQMKAYENWKKPFSEVFNNGKEYIDSQKKLNEEVSNQKRQAREDALETMQLYVSGMDMEKAAILSQSEKAVKEGQEMIEELNRVYRYSLADDAKLTEPEQTEIITQYETLASNINTSYKKGLIYGKEAVELYKQLADSEIGVAASMSKAIDGAIDLTKTDWTQYKGMSPEEIIAKFNESINNMETTIAKTQEVNVVVNLSDIVINDQRDIETLVNEIAKKTEQQLSRVSRNV